VTIPLNGHEASSDPELTQVSSATAVSKEQIGPYRLLQLVGEGGMGEVWLAEQTRPVRRQVALKIIKAGMDTAQVVARFEAERQALALMDHPAIARVFDAGATPQSRPYFVMEYVRGEAITTYCSRHRLTTRQRIDLFLDVCDAVQHAHQKGIIHRDLKPSNILVTVRDDKPVPKIIDFGIAKATTQHLTDRTLVTELGSLVGTLEYMSPEQAEMTSLDVDTRSDVYSLGVILYELLTDVLPFESKSLREQSIEEIRRIIRETDPPRPSTRVTTVHASAMAGQHSVARTTASELRGDLDWITMRALEKDRTRRYGSASDLAADLRRHLARIPVLAGPPSTSYRVAKFVSRHRLGVATAATLVVLLMAFAASMAVQARRIARERDRANQEAEAARQVSNFLIGLFNVSDPSEAHGNTLTAREILDKGATEIEQRLADQPSTRARLETTIGKVYTSLGLYAAAEPLLRRAFATARDYAGSDATDTLAATSALADVYWYLGRYPDAEPLYADLVPRRQRLFGERHPDTLKANYDLASLYVMQGRVQDGETLARKVHDIQRQVLGDEHPDTLSSLNNLGAILHRQQRYADELPIRIQLLETDRRRSGENHPNTLRDIHNLATVYSGLGRYDEAEKLFISVIKLSDQVLGELHPASLGRRAALAGMYQKRRHFAEAEEQLLRVVWALNLHQPGRTVISGSGGTIDFAQRLVELYDAWGKPDKAAEWRAKLPKDTKSQP
jgi:eukaryotic-like serine/threonine-protein kinase